MNRRNWFRFNLISSIVMVSIAGWNESMGNSKTAWFGLGMGLYAGREAIKDWIAYRKQS